MPGMFSSLTASLNRIVSTAPAHLFHAFEGLTRMGTAPKTATEGSADEQHASKILEDMVSRLGLEPRTLALKGRSTSIAIGCD